MRIFLELVKILAFSCLAALLFSPYLSNVHTAALGAGLTWLLVARITK